MLRVIKFRGWSVIESKWVYGSLLQSEIDVNELNVKCQIHERFANDFSIAKYDVIPESVGQFTGLKGKNKDIYEGDIIRISSRGMTFTCKVEWFRDLIPIDKFSNNYEHMLYSPIWEESEITGNIYQNPELLETVQK